MSNKWFESVAVAQKRAERILPPSVVLALRAGTDKGLTLTDNVEAFSELGVLPRIAELPSDIDLSTSVAGVDVSMPILSAPVGVQAVHPEAEVAVARAAAARGTISMLSCFGSKPIEEVAAANPKTFMQTYWVGSREEIEVRTERARAAGAAGLVVTLDWSFVHSRDWGSPKIPDAIDLKTMAKFAPEAIRAPRWTTRWLKDGKLPNLTVPNMAMPGGHEPTFFEAYGQWMGTPSPTWDDIAWLRELWGGPFVVKGVMRVDDAKAAVSIGADAISVSNHGGNNLDSTPASIRALGPIVDAVGGDIEVLVDSGIRRGSDVAKALALGAKAALVGRAPLYGLVVDGQAGVENVFDVLADGLRATVRSLGHRRPEELSPTDLLVPDGFHRSL